MKKISEIYKLKLPQEKLDFIDLLPDIDNLLFIDPRLIESQNSDLAKRMRKCIKVFWSNLISHIRAGDKKGAIALLRGISEPNETHLGYSDGKSSGNSAGKKLRRKMVDSLSRNKAVKTGVLSHIGDAELFVPKIGADRISDIATKIIKRELIKFTQEQCKKHKIKMTLVPQKDIFIPESIDWKNSKSELPVYNGKPLIFVPKNIVREDGAVSSNLWSFYRYSVRFYLAEDKNILKSIKGTGKKGKIWLKDIQKAHPFSKDSFNDWITVYGKLLIDYKDSIKDRIVPLTDEQISQIINKKNK
jgi:hypothetical protein